MNIKDLKYNVEHDFKNKKDKKIFDFINRLSQK